MRTKRDIDAAMASMDGRLHLSVTDEELDGVLSAGAMHHAAQLEGKAPLPAHLAWYAHRGGISEAAKVLASIVAEVGPCSAAAVWSRIGNGLGEREWGCFLDEAIATGLVVRTSDGRLAIRLRRAA